MSMCVLVGDRFGSEPTKNKSLFYCIDRFVPDKRQSRENRI